MTHYLPVFALACVAPVLAPGLPSARAQERETAIDLSILQDDSEPLADRIAACDRIGKAGPKSAPTTVPVLVKMLGERRAAFRDDGAEGAEAAKKANDQQLVRAALMALAKMGPAAKPAVPVLRTYLKLQGKHDTSFVEPVQLVLNVLRAIGPDSIAAAPQVGAILTAFVKQEPRNPNALILVLVLRAAQYRDPQFTEDVYALAKAPLWGGPDLSPFTLQREVDDYNQMVISPNPLTVEEHRQNKIRWAAEARATEIKLRREAIRVLGWIGTPRAKECLLRLTRSDVPELRAAAEAALDGFPTDANK